MLAFTERVPGMLNEATVQSEKLYSGSTLGTALQFATGAKLLPQSTEIRYWYSASGVRPIITASHSCPGFTKFVLLVAGAWHMPV